MPIHQSIWEQIVLTSGLFIVPTTRLIERVRQSTLDEETKYMLCCKEYWVETASGPLVQTAYTVDDEINQVRVMYLANIHYEYIRSAEDSDSLKRFVLEVLGDPPWDLPTFDKWWQIEEVEIQYSISDVRNGLSLEDLNAVSLPKDDLVERWHSRLIEKKSTSD